MSKYQYTVIIFFLNMYAFIDFCMLFFYVSKCLHMNLSMKVSCYAYDVTVWNLIRSTVEKQIIFKLSNYVIRFVLFPCSQLRSLKSMFRHFNWLQASFRTLLNLQKRANLDKTEVFNVQIFISKWKLQIECIYW